MPATKSKKTLQALASRRLYRFALCLWSAAGLVAIFAPWPYALGTVLFATFLHFSALDEDPHS